MTKFVTYTAKQFRGSIGEAVIKILTEETKVHYDAQLVTVVPRMLAYFGQMPERFEVIEADVIIKFNE